MKIINISNKIKLTKTQFQIVNYINSNIKSLPWMTLDKISKSCHVSTTTVFRLIQKIGYKNLKDLKNKLKDLNQISTIDPILKKYNNAIKQIQFINSSSEITKAKQVIENSKEIVVLGEGENNFVCKMLANQLYAKGYNVRPLTLTSLEKNSLLKSQESKLVIAISYSGKTKSLVDFINIISQKENTKLLSITLKNNNAISNQAYASLYIPTVFANKNDNIQFTIVLRLVITHILQNSVKNKKK